MQPLSFAAKNDRGWRCVFDVVVALLAALIDSVDPVAFGFQLFNGAVDVYYPYDGNVLECSGGGFCDGLVQPGSTALRNQDGAGASGMGCADDGAQIVRILHAIEQNY